MSPAVDGPYRTGDYGFSTVVSRLGGPGVEDPVAMAVDVATAKTIVAALNAQHIAEHAEGGDVAALADALRAWGYGYVDPVDDTIPTRPVAGGEPVWVQPEQLARQVLGWLAARGGGA